MRTVNTIIRLGGCPDRSESSLGAQVILLVFVVRRLTCYAFSAVKNIQEHVKKSFPAVIDNEGRNEYLVKISSF